MAPIQLHSAPCLASRRHIVAKGNFDSLPNRVKLLRCCPAQLHTGRLAVTARQSHIVWAAAAETTTELGPSASDEDDSKQEAQESAEERLQGNKAIVVGDKPAANSLLRRLEQVPQTTIRAYTNNNEMHTYKTVTTMATAQRMLNQPGKVLLYVPYTKGRFSAIVLTTSSRVLHSNGNINRLQVKANTNPEALARTLSFDLVKHDTAVVESSGAAATAKAEAALMLVRQQMLKRGYELGVVPRFEEQKITIVSQQVVLQELPVPCVNLPRTNTKPLDAAAAAARTMLSKQRRVQLLLPPAQLNRLSGLLAQVMRPERADQRQQERGSNDQRPLPEEKKRLLVAWPPSTADQLLESLEQLNQFATAAMAESDVTTGSATAGTTAQVAVDDQQAIQLQLRRSRLVSLPSPEAAFMRGGPGARSEDRKPAVATSDSSIAGLAGAIEARVARTGASWLVTDGSKDAHAIAWQAFLYASSKMDAADGAGGLLALVDVQEVEQPARQQQGSQQHQQATAADASNTQQAQPTEAEKAGDTAEQQQPWKAKVEQQAKAQQRAQQRQQQERRRKGEAATPTPQPNYKLKMLIVRDSDIARSILQSPNTPLEVSVSADLWPLFKFATAANTFLPIHSRTAGTGGLVLLPAVLPAPAEPATASEAVAADYRFDDQKQQLVPYAIRLQRFTGKLQEGLDVEDSQQLRVSLSTDPIKLRDAIVAKVLQQQPASVRFVGPLGRTPPLLTIAMAAVAAARVRLQQKGSPTDVGIMPYSETLTGPAPAASAADGEAAVASGKGRRQQGGRGGASVQAGRVVYSLRLVPIPAVGPAATEAGTASDDK